MQPPPSPQLAKLTLRCLLKLTTTTVVQASTNTPATLDKAERLLAEAASYFAILIVLPEAFTGGYPRGSNFGVTIGSRTTKGKEEFRKYHASAIDVPA